MDQIQKLQQDFDEIKRQVGELRSGVGGQATTLGAQSTVDPKPPPVSPPNPTADQTIRNGDGSFSTNGYLETVLAPPTDDRALECAWFFISDTPAAGQALDVSTTAITNSDNKTLKAVGHSHYDARYPDWGLPAGTFRMSGTGAINAPFPSNAVYPGRTMYLGAIVALRNSTIRAPAGCRIAAALYNNTPVELDFMKAGQPFGLRGQVRGTPAATTPRGYRILAETDRGYTFLSAELVLNAPTDASFTSNVDVSLNWDPIDGILKYSVFRHNVVAGTYDLLREVTSGSNTYGDNNSILQASVGAYPVATDDRVKCFIATPTGDLADLPVDGVDPKWADLALNIPVPTPLEKTGSGNQLLRVYMTEALDREPTDAVAVAGSASIQSNTGEFTVLDTARIATLFDADGNVLHGPEAITFVDATHVTFATNVATGYTDGSLFILGGGDHGLLLDMIHVGQIARAKYASYPDDKNRTLPSTAAPNESGQGGIGGGGDSSDPGTGGIVKDPGDGLILTA